MQLTRDQLKAALESMKDTLHIGDSIDNIVDSMWNILDDGAAGGGGEGTVVSSEGVYTLSNVTESRTLDANAATTAQLSDVVGTLINDLQISGVLTLTPPPDVENVILIPIWGQSNASGRLQTAGELPVYVQGAVPNVKIWNWDDPSPAWQDLQVGVNNNRDTELNADWFGPEMELGYRMQQEFGGTIYLVKVALTGSGMDLIFTSTSWNANRAGALCDAFIAAITAARANLIAAGKTVLINAMYGMQGEAEIGESLSVRQAWTANRVGFYDKVKSQLGLATLYDVFGKVKYPGAAADDVRAAQAAYVAVDPARNFMIDTTSYTVVDGLHFDGVSQIKQGLDAFNIIKNFY